MNFVHLFIGLFVYLFIVNSTFAQTMKNDWFKIIMGNLNMAAGNVSRSQYKLSERAGETVPGLYSGANYKVKAGFQYVRVTIPFSFSISQNIIDFGIFSPTNAVNRTTNLTISSGSAKGFTVIASENNPMTSATSTIPDTTCDNGDCNSSKAALWTSSLSYGFGYRCDDLSGTNCVSGFSANFFKPFPVTPSNQSIMTSTKGGRSRKSQITYKANVAGSQASRVYTNIVTYIASPGF